MNIYFTNRFELVIEANNVKIVEDVESRDYNVPKRDVSTDYIDKFASVLEDMICYRVEEFDSRRLIEGLFSKLPEDIAQRLSFNLYDEYGQHD